MLKRKTKNQADVQKQVHTLNAEGYKNRFCEMEFCKISHARVDQA